MEMDVPHEMLHPQGGMSVGGHIKLINHQLAQIRAGLALATALGRKLILPSVTCGYDKYWGPLWRGGSPPSDPGSNASTPAPLRAALGPLRDALPAALLLLLLSRERGR